MTAKKITTWVLLTFVAASVAYAGIFALKQKAASNAEGTDVYKSIDEKPGQYVLTSEYTGNVDVVCYFLTTQRCANCYNIETYTKETLDEQFASRLNDASLIWKPINVDEEPNRHFIKDFELHTKSVVLVKIRGGKQVEWKNLDRVWALLGDKDSFKSYIGLELSSFLAKG